MEGSVAISGPSEEPESSRACEPKLPGDFVSEDLRDDCARFLEELQALIARRAEMPPNGAQWVPRRTE
jgi:hypothetical protein